MKPWRYSLYTFNNDSTPILTYRHNLALVVLILHSHLEHFDDLSFFGAILVTRNIFFNQISPNFLPHIFFRSKNRHDFWRLSIGLLWLFFSRSRNLTSSFSGKKIDFFFFMEEFISILNGFLNWTQITLIMHEDFDIILLIL